ncbi:MAG TPA: translesion error-prone DNA polymerase V autoproteolytic subunit [Flavobacterium sp.]|jgi:DNA polymerase V
MSIKLTILKPDFESTLKIPFSEKGVPAGFPSPALDFMEGGIDLNKALSENPLATFYIRVDGNSMVNAGIDDKDVLVVDRSLNPKDGSIAICVIDGGFTVKRLRPKKDGMWLIPENPDFKQVKITAENDFQVWGIVTYVIKKIK